jgi:hypothetical protein
MADVDKVIALMVANKEPKEKIIEFINNYKKQKAASKAGTETEVEENGVPSTALTKTITKDKLSGGDKGKGTTTNTVNYVNAKYGKGSISNPKVAAGSTGPISAIDQSVGRVRETLIKSGETIPTKPVVSKKTTGGHVGDGSGLENFKYDHAEANRPTSKGIQVWNDPTTGKLVRHPDQLKKDEEEKKKQEEEMVKKIRLQGQQKKTYESWIEDNILHPIGNYAAPRVDVITENISETASQVAEKMVRGWNKLGEHINDFGKDIENTFEHALEDTKQTWAIGGGLADAWWTHQSNKLGFGGPSEETVYKNNEIKAIDVFKEHGIDITKATAAEFIADHMTNPDGTIKGMEKEIIMEPNLAAGGYYPGRGDQDADFRSTLHYSQGFNYNLLPDPYQLAQTLNHDDAAIMMQWLYGKYVVDGEVEWYQAGIGMGDTGGDWLSQQFGLPTSEERIYSSSPGSDNKETGGNLMNRLNNSPTFSHDVMKAILAKQDRWDTANGPLSKLNDLDKSRKLENEYFDVNRGVLSPLELEIKDLMKAGDYSTIEKKLRESGQYMLVNKDGSLINYTNLDPEDISSDAGITIVSQEIEDAAKAEAERTDLDELIEAYEGSHIGLINAAKLYNRMWPDAPQPDPGGDALSFTQQFGMGTIGFLASNLGQPTPSSTKAYYEQQLEWGHNADDFNKAMQNVENGVLSYGLFPVKGSNNGGQRDGAAQAYNEALARYLTLGRAVELNIDISKNKEETFYEDNMGLGLKLEKSQEIFNETKEVLQFIENPDFAKLSGDVKWGPDFMLFKEEVNLQDAVEIGSDMVKSLVPLAVTVAMVKKGRVPVLAAGASKIDKVSKAIVTTEKVVKGAKIAPTIAPATTTIGSAVNNTFTSLHNVLKQGAMGKTLIGRQILKYGLAGAEEFVFLLAADQIAAHDSAKGLGAHPFIYDPKTRELNWEFAFGLGVGNKVMGNTFKNLNKTAWGRKFNYNVGRIFGSTGNDLVNKTVGSVAGVGSMEIAKLFSGDSQLVELLFQDTDFTKWEENGYKSEDEYRKEIEIQNNKLKVAYVKELAGNVIGMFGFSMIQPGNGITTAMMRDVKNFKLERLNIDSDAKYLGIKGNPKEATVDVIEKAVREKKKKVREDLNKTDRTKKDKDKAIKELQNIKIAKDNMHDRLHIREAQKQIKDWDKKRYDIEFQVFDLNQKIANGGEFSGKEMIDLATIGKAEFEYIVKKINNKNAAEGIKNRKNFYEVAYKYVKDFGNVSNIKEARKFMEETVDFLKKGSELALLKANNTNGINDAKIINSKEKYDASKEKQAAREKELESRYKEFVAREITVAKVMAEALGVEFEIATSEKQYESISKNKKTAAFYGLKNNKPYILINPWQAVKARSIGTGIHEVTHHIIKSLLKGKDGKVTEEGIIIVDKFLKTLSDKDRAWVENDIIERGYIESKEGKWTKSEKEEFYDEYLTVYVEGLKNEFITLDLSSAQKIQNLFLPRINKVFPNIGKKSIKEFTPEDASNVKDLLDNLYLESNRIGATSKYDLKIFMETNPTKVADAYDKFSNTSYSKFPEMERINKIAEQYTKEEWKEGKWEETYVEILPDIIKLLTSKAEKANLAFPGIIENPKLFAYEVANELSGMNLGQRNVGGHIKNFDITKKVTEGGEGKFGLSGWINNVANEKMWNVMKKADKLRDPKNTQSLDSQEAKELAYEGPSTIEIIEREMSNEMVESRTLESDKLKVHEVMASVQKGYGEKAKSIHDGIREVFTKTNQLGQKVVDADKLAKFVSGKNMKSLPRLALKETVDLFVRDVSIKNPKTGEVKRYKAEDLVNSIANKIEKNKNLDTSEIIALQNGLDRWIPMIYEYVIPEGFITKQVNYKNKEGEMKSEQVPSATTGIPNKILAITHNKRSIAGVTTLDGTKVRTKENFFGQYKKPYTASIVNELREAIGIMKDGTRNTNSRKDLPVKGLEGVGETLKGVTSLVEKMITNQGIRDILYSEGKLFEAEMLAIADGKPSKSFAKSADKKSLEQLVSDSKEKLKTDFQINPDKTLQFINKITELYNNYNQKEWKDFKLKEGYDLMTGLEEWLFTPETQAQVSNYTKLMFNVHNHILKMASKGGVVHEYYRIIVRDPSGNKIISKNGEKQFEMAESALKNFHPSVLLVTNLMAKLGFKSLTFDGRTLPFSLKGVNLKEVKSELTVKQIKKLEKNFKDLGIDIEAAVKESVDMVAKSPEVKKAINAIYKNNKTVSEKFKEVDIDAIEKFNNGNQNLLKLLTESHRLNNDKWYYRS